MTGLTDRRTQPIIVKDIFGCLLGPDPDNAPHDCGWNVGIFISNRLQSYFAMINRNHNPDKNTD